ncbi:uncharacterized protein LOC110770298 isoform X2 [Prunus avium]|uniref:Uncharacterized protein LOC110770298 isoform X2 n=1 Tax=Prunus avium TaxID=42229 RepID=A0A6P5TT25_PRUAV|nr:uncharacterized protein LOC110770298 isoform X2 [Prunus avium]XP_021830102.1 uncharacterized protein LOC110770298 isoform X2 [Prunus avium]
MERNSAACVMEWSIELEKALRSKKPGRSLEGISEISPRLQQLSKEPDPSPAVYHLFDLIPGEDKLFSNAIILRLANAFEFGDKHTRVCIVKAFLFEYRKRNKWKEYKGVLCKTRVHMQAELLRRVKVVFDNEDVEDRALALGLFGCWAHFAKPTASMQYLVLSSMVCSHVLEVQAALFAAGCFAELSEDFACVVLEMLLHMMSSPETLPAIRLAGARLFAKLGCSQSLANNAYKASLKLLLEFSDEYYQVAMLVSLSKLASKSTILISQQVDLLLLFLSHEKTLHLRATALRCLHFFFSQGMCHVPVNGYLVKTLLSILDEPQIPTSMLCEVLQTLRKMILCMPPNLPSDVLESSKLLSITENASRSPIMTESLLAISVLVDMSRRLKGSTGMGSIVRCSSLQPSQVILLIIDQITILVKPILDLCQADSVEFPQVNCLFNLLFLLIREYPDLHVLVLDEISVLVKSLSYSVDLKGENSRIIRSKLLFKVYRFLVAFLENLTEAGAISTEVFDKVKLLVELVCQSNLFECYTYTLYSLLLRCQIIWGNMGNESEGSRNPDKNSGISLDNYSMKHELRTIECAKRMLAEKNNWPAYRVGVYAVCQGDWLTSTFIFKQLVLKVRSNSCSCWVKSLVQFADSERKLELLLSPKQGLETYKLHLTPSSNDLGCQDAASNIKEHIYSKELAAAYNGLCSSLETLKVGDVKMGHTFFFQHWFLSLRVKVIKAVVDIVKILGNIQFDQDNTTNTGKVEKLMVGYLISLQKITQISLQLKRLAQEFDLVTTSFIDMDKKSSKIISELAMSCSLLAFCTGFALYIPGLIKPISNSGLGILERDLDAMLVQNLVGRLGNTNHETSKNLCLLLEAGRNPMDCFHMQSRTQACKIGSKARDILSVCNYAVSGIAGLKRKANRVHNEEGLSQLPKDGLKLMYDILMKWMQIPFRTPTYFFKFRPCHGSELFAVNETRNPDGIYVSPGFNLSLNLCLQLRNVAPDIPVRFKNLYCMLYSRVSFQEPAESGVNNQQKQGSYQACETDDMVEMNEKLLQYVTECSTKKSNKRRRGNNDGEFVNSFVRFELNERGQGFSNCLLDVSAFPVGSYRIKWHSCCIDSQGTCWTLPHLNLGPVFTVHRL